MVLIKKLSIKEIDDIVMVENDSWDSELRADKNTLIERLQRFPAGFIGAYIGEKLAGIGYGHPILSVKNTWYENSRSEAFNPEGKIFYIVNIGVSKYFRGNGVGTALIDENKKLALELGYEKIVLGARKTEKNHAFYTKNGFTSVESIEAYLPEDTESGGIGVIMEFTL